MRKRILALSMVTALCIPCLLIANEELNWLNVAGFVWLLFLMAGGMKYIVPAWVWDEVKAFCSEED